MRIDAELKKQVARATEKARAKEGKEAADAARHKAAQELELPIKEGRVVYPDAQIEYQDIEGRSGRVNVEIASRTLQRQARLPPKPRLDFRYTATADGPTPRSAGALGKAGPGGGGDGSGGAARGGSRRINGALQVMRPWHVSIGLTVTALGVVAIFGLPELAFYKPHWSVLFPARRLANRRLWRHCRGLVRILDLCQLPGALGLG